MIQVPERVAEVDPPGIGVTVERAQRGDEVAFQRLVEVRLASLLRLAMAIIGDEADARDAVQDACVSAWRALPTLREPDRFDAWLGRILTNSCRMALRGRRRRRVREIAVGSLGADAQRRIHEDAVPDPGDQVDELEILDRAFETLDPDLRIALTLHYLEGWPVDELAALTGVSLATAKWRLHTARGALARALQAERR
jgi:RNA polymerase sigma-70 factor (ECF subfamily)